MCSSDFDLWHGSQLNKTTGASFGACSFFIPPDHLRSPLNVMGFFAVFCFLLFFFIFLIVFWFFIVYFFPWHYLFSTYKLPYSFCNIFMILRLLNNRMIFLNLFFNSFHLKLKFVHATLEMLSTLSNSDTLSIIFRYEVNVYSTIVLQLIKIII